MIYVRLIVIAFILYIGYMAYNTVADIKTTYENKINSSIYE